MAGRPQGAAARDVMLRIRITTAGAKALDIARGGLTRSAYVRELIAKDIQKKGITG